MIELPNRIWEKGEIIQSISNMIVLYVKEMVYEEYDEEKYKRMMQEEYKEEGREEGRKEGRKEGIKLGIEQIVYHMFDNSRTVEEVSDLTGQKIEYIDQLHEKYTQMVHGNEMYHV